MRRTLGSLIGGSVALLFGACSFTSLDELQSGAGGAAGTGGDALASTSSATDMSSSSAASDTTSTAHGGDGGDGGAGAGAGGSASGGGGAGGAPPDLVDTGLLVRYFIDDAGSGVAPTHVTDAASAPLDLSIDYAEGNGMAFTTEDGHRGLGWRMAGDEGIAETPVAGTKVFPLDQSVYGTLEVVVRVDEASVAGSRLLHVGTGVESTFTIAASHLEETEIAPPSRVELRTKSRGDPDPLYHFIYFDTELAGQRAVLHAVYDTREDVPEDRVRMYRDGVRIPITTAGEELPAADESLFVDPADLIAVGNRLVGDRSIQGTIFYAALYLAALSDEEITHNAETLAARDDR